jgi:protein-S-isoprenylcysteine O-methyltransferase Ste14
MMPHNLPAFLIGMIVAIYWARVLRMTRKSTRRVGKRANLIPAEPVGIITRIVWTPVVFLWIAIPLLAAYDLPHAAIFQPLFNFPSVGWCGTALAFAAFILTLICWRSMGRSWRVGIDPSEKTPLIVTGPYARVRHPIYALSTLMMLASVAACPTLPMIVVAVLHLGLLQFEIHREESHLKQVHGAAYEDYCRRAGRFLPRPANPNPPKS